MNLFELKEEIDETEIDIDYYKSEKERLENMNSTEKVLIELEKTIMYLDSAKIKLANLNRNMNNKYNKYKEVNNYDKQIYIEKKLKKWSNAKISARHNGIGKSQIYRIIDKIEKGKKGEK